MDDPGLSAGPPYAGPTGKDFVPFGVGLVQLGDVIRVEGRLTENDPAKLEFGQEVELTMVPFTTDEDGNEIVTFAFQPVTRPRRDAMTERRSDHRRGPAPVRPVRQDRHGDGRRGNPVALTDAGVEWKDIQFGFGGSYEVSNPDAVTRLVGLTGITFTNVFNACATAATAIQQTADTIRLGKYDIGIAIGMDKHPRGAFTDDPAKLAPAAVVRRERSVRHHQVLRDEGQPLHPQARHLARRRWPRWRPRTSATVR